MKIEVSNGEIVDKQTILVIKKNKIKDKSKLKNIEIELDILNYVITQIEFNVEDHINLLEINRRLWYVEDQLRLCEYKKRFDDHFIQLARQVYHLNDRRARIKKQINLSTGSTLVEEKSYT
jgi:hypothetical protein